VKLSTIVFVSLTLLPSLAAADVLHLKNGRTLEGRVMAERNGQIILGVRGGTFHVPRATVRRVERSSTASELYALRLRSTDMSSPGDVEALSEWASRRGLGTQARQLRRLANGQRLEQRVSQARKEKDAGAFLQTYHWAQTHGFRPDVLRYLLEEALKLNPSLEPARRSLRSLGPHKVRPEPGKVNKRIQPQRTPEPKRPTPAEADAERQSELERRLAEQKSEAEALRKRLAQLEREETARLKRTRLDRRRRRARARRGRRAPGLYFGPYLLEPATKSPPGKGSPPRRTLPPVR
jgi:hypothetical protein